ncbi:Ribokinase-like protein [Xylariaceae sp. FL0804]|nr:Ribokinase-like protein [Xylariaceae sp. FL0804]
MAATAAGTKTRAPVITVLGSLNIDLVSYVPHHPLPGETLTSTSFAVSPGGKGANQAVACAKLSRSRAAPVDDDNEAARVRMVGAVGADSYGETLRENLRAHGVDVSGVTASPGLKTGVAIIIVDQPTGQNRIVLSPEANHSFTAEQFRELPAPRPDLLIMQLEIPLPAVLAALAAARRADVPVLLNPAPAQPLPEEAYQGLAHLVVNETEAAILTGVPEAELATESGLERVARLFAARGVAHVVVTLGGRGVYYYFHQYSPRVGGGGGGRLVPAHAVADVVDTTAAGDTFVGQYALLAAAASSLSSPHPFDIGDAVERANVAAARTVEKLGAQDSIPWRDEL